MLLNERVCSLIVCRVYSCYYMNFQNSLDLKNFLPLSTLIVLEIFSSLFRIIKINFRISIDTRFDPVRVSNRC